MIDYKKIIRSRKLRLAILRILNFIPDKWMLKLQYRIKMGKKLNLKNPQRFSEKSQWYKLYYRNPLMPKCVEKGDVRGYVRDCGLKDILNECYGIYDRVEDIDFDALPDKFVVKDTLGGGGNSVVIVKDKSELDITALKKQMSTWIGENAHIKDVGREWPYSSGRPHGRIIIEKYIESDETAGGLIDYKFFCFNGRAEYLYVIADRKLGGDAGFGIYTADFQKTDYTRVGERKLAAEVEKPVNYEEMKAAAEKLSAAFPHARVDMYNRNGKIVFGEITFFSASGYTLFDPDEFDYILGERFVLPERNK